MISERGVLGWVGGGGGGGEVDLIKLPYFAYSDRQTLSNSVDRF